MDHLRWARNTALENEAITHRRAGAEHRQPKHGKGDPGAMAPLEGRRGIVGLLFVELGVVVVIVPGVFLPFGMIVRIFALVRVAVVMVLLGVGRIMVGSVVAGGIVVGIIVVMRRIRRS